MLDLFHANLIYFCCFIFIEIGYKITNLFKNKSRSSPSGEYSNFEFSYLNFRVTLFKCLFVVFNYFIICCMQLTGTLSNALWEIIFFSLFFLLSGILFSLYLFNCSWFNTAYELDITDIKYGTGIVLESNVFYSRILFNDKEFTFSGIFNFLCLLNKETCKLYFLMVCDKETGECKVLVSLKPHICSLCGFVRD